MRRSFLFNAAAVTGAFALGCADQEPTTAPAADQATPSLSVERGTGVFPFGVFGFSDGRRTLIFGAPFEDLVSFCPAPVPPVDLFDLLTVTRPDGSTKLLFKGEDVHVVVFDAVSSTCDNTLLDAPRFTGTVRVALTDSDADLSGHGADASQITVTGTVTDESGQQYHLVVSSHQVLSPASTLDPFNLVVLNSKVKIQLTPIGR
jgi:hypothetical protein